MDYLDGLNPAQRAAASKIDGPMMVIAGAGSGKTRVLTYRIAHLIKNGIDPFNILSLTFTNKAAKEMKERIGQIIGESESKNIWMGTFHSVFARILRSEAELIGYPKNFTIYDTQDSRNAIKSIIKEMNLDDKVYKPSLVQHRISSAKNNLISSRAYLSNDQIMSEDKQSAKPKIGEIYAIYEKKCFKAGAMDFDDLLFKTNILLRDFPEVLHKYQHRFKYILVDEYQDTNFSQYLIVKKLAAVNENICVVGDDAQSIYAFRGANIQNILNFKRDYPDYQLFKLEQNYRSTKTIVEAANSIISNNKEQIKKDVWTDNENGKAIKVLGTTSDKEEAKLITNEIYDTYTDEGLSYNDFAILYRTNAQSRSFEETLRKQNIPYKIYGGLSFYQRKEVKDLLAYFRLVANPKDEESLKRIINYPKRGIGKTTIDKAIIKSNEDDVSLYEVLSKPQEHPFGVGAASYTKIGEFFNMISAFGVQLDKKPAFELATEIAQTSKIIPELYADKTPEGVSRYENIQELLNGIKDFTDSAEEGETRTLADFLVDVALLTDADKDEDKDEPKVTLMTVHSAKGLEFPYVHIVGMEENLFPSQMALSTRSELEEERRLFYVAVTRAEKKCTLSYATSRYRWGQQIFCEPSRFIEEIDEKYLERIEPKKETFQFDETPWGGGFGQSKGFQSAANNKYKKFHKAPKKEIKKEEPRIPLGVGKKLVKASEAARKSTNNSSNFSEYKEGDEVIHDRFGKGKVLKVEGAAPNTKATIFFPKVGQKQVLLKFAKLEKI